jgi:hypothetical protein
MIARSNFATPLEIQTLVTDQVIHRRGNQGDEPNGAFGQGRNAVNLAVDAGLHHIWASTRLVSERVCGRNVDTVNRRAAKKPPISDSRCWLTAADCVHIAFT